MGSAYKSGNNFLFQCDLQGNTVQLLQYYYNIPGSVEEHMVASSFGIAGWPDRDIYVGYMDPSLGPSIYRIDRSTGSITNPAPGTGPFASLPRTVGQVTGVMFDPLGPKQARMRAMVAGHQICLYETFVSCKAFDSANWFSRVSRLAVPS